MGKWEHATRSTLKKKTFPVLCLIRHLSAAAVAAVAASTSKEPTVTRKSKKNNNNNKKTQKATKQKMHKHKEGEPPPRLCYSAPLKMANYITHFIFIKK